MGKDEKLEELIRLLKKSKRSCVPRGSYRPISKPIRYNPRLRNYAIPSLKYREEPKYRASKERPSSYTKPWSEPIQYQQKERLIYDPEVKRILERIEKHLSSKPDVEEMIKQLESNPEVYSKISDRLLEKMNEDSEKLEEEVKKAYTETGAKDVEIDNDKKESDTDRIDIEKKDEFSESVTSEEEKFEAEESLEDKEEAESVETDEKQEVEAAEDIKVQDIESLPENVNEGESPVETQETIEQVEPNDEAEELPVESFDQSIEELYSELYEIESEPIEEVEHIEETEGY
ncbi:MAG: hypothetical protein QXH91_04230 [Candidatus Bathyarchaeia archaeon]